MFPLVTRLTRAPGPGYTALVFTPLSGSSVVVTGGSKGIGRGIAERLSRSGHRVAATYRSGDVPEGVLGVRCDVTDGEQVEAAFTEVEAALGRSRCWWPTPASPATPC